MSQKNEIYHILFSTNLRWLFKFLTPKWRKVCDAYGLTFPQDLAGYVNFFHYFWISAVLCFGYNVIHERLLFKMCIQHNEIHNFEAILEIMYFVFLSWPILKNESTYIEKEDVLWFPLRQPHKTRIETCTDCPKAFNNGQIWR